MKIDIGAMSFIQLLDFLDQFRDEVIVPARLQNILRSSDKVFPFASVGEYLAEEGRAGELLAHVPNFGKKTLSDLNRLLQEAISFANNDINERRVSQLEPIASQSPLVVLSQDQLETPISNLSFPASHHKLIKKIVSVTTDAITVKDLLRLDPLYFSELPGVGKRYKRNLIVLQSELPLLLERQKQKLSSINVLEFNEVDTALIEDIESYLWTFDEMKIDIALSRWGFNHMHETLVEVAKRYDKTRERIRQIEKTINENLPLRLTVPSRVLWAMIRTRLEDDLTVALPSLAACFATDKLFYSFIEQCCQVPEGSISKIIYTKIRSEVINSFFQRYPSPIAHEVVVNELMSSYGYDRASAINGIKQLKRLGKIEVDERGISPKDLSRADAVSHILISHPEGLPWKDVLRLINIKSITSAPVDESRAMNVFGDSEGFYLYGRGVYRSLYFLNLEQFDIPQILKHLIAYLNQSKITAANLHDYFCQTARKRVEIDYFTLRHIVREYGEDSGLYFDGKSSVDNISLVPNFKSITQADVIIKLLNDSKVALTTQEIAERLKSKSAHHAYFYLKNLRDEGKVVRVDKVVYTTPEKAFIGMDINGIMKIIHEILDIPNTIVEADVFREYVNLELNLSYSKYMYAALVNAQLETLGWYRQGTLFCKSQIPYRSLIDMCKQLCDPVLSNDENIEILKRNVWLSDAVAASVLQQWRLDLTIRSHALK